MIEGIINTIKANKGKIIKKTLIIVGAAVGLAIVAKAVASKRNGDEGIESEENCEVTEN